MASVSESAGSFSSHTDSGTRAPANLWLHHPLEPHHSLQLLYSAGEKGKNTGRKGAKDMKRDSSAGYSGGTGHVTPGEVQSEPLGVLGTPVGVAMVIVVVTRNAGGHGEGKVSYL